MQDRPIFLHVGMHKTGTTFLQQEVFSKWRGVTSVSFAPLNYIIKKMGENDNPLLISNEGLAGSPWYPWIPWRKGFDLKWSENRKVCLRNLKALFPDAHILISFRKHLDLILSYYKQYLHEGGYIGFNEFFDIDNNRGSLKREDFLFKDIVTEIRKNFSCPDFIFTHEELHGDPDALLADLEKFIGGEAPSGDKKSMKRKNVGVGHYQAKILRALNRVSRSYLNPDGRINLTNKFTVGLGIHPRKLCQQRLAFISKRKLYIGRETEERITEFYRDDWEYTQREVSERKKMLPAGAFRLEKQAL